MPKRSSKERPPTDENVAAKRLAEDLAHQSGEEAEEPQDESYEPLGAKNPHAVALGRLGGRKGGPARAKALSKKRRSDIARKAAKARWRRRDEV